MGMGATPVFPVVLTHRDGNQPWTITPQGGATSAHDSLAGALLSASHGGHTVLMSPFTVEAVRAAVTPPRVPTTIAELAALPGWTSLKVVGRPVAMSPDDRWPQVEAGVDGSVWLYPVEDGGPAYLYDRADEAGAVRLALDLYRAFNGD
jgi:hypothetical protein